jgi:two-component sensor histidine kinase
VIHVTDQSAAKTPSTVARRLLLMALTLAAPAILLMAVLVVVQVNESRQRFNTQLQATTHALSLATERQIGEGQSVLLSLSFSPALADGDFQTFDKQAREAVQGHDAWIVLLNRRGQKVNTLLPRGTALPTTPMGVEPYAQIQRGQTIVSNLGLGSAARGPVVSVTVPARVAGELYGLAYVQRPTAFRALLAAQEFPRGWNATISDRKGAVIARSRRHDEFVGQKINQAVRDALLHANEGIVRSETLDHVKTFAAFSRSPTSGWAFVIGVPRQEVYRTLLGSLGPALAGSIALIVLSVLAAFAFARPISDDVRALVAEAETLANSAMLEPAPSQLQEIAEVRSSLRAAAGVLRHRDLEVGQARQNQLLMIHELNHRVKNTLAIVQSLARSSLSESGPDGLEKFNERIFALSRAHNLLTRQGWEGADLRELVSEALESHAGRVTLNGPDTPLTPNSAVALAMVFHELAGNAAKYGALSVKTGRVTVNWRRLPSDGLVLTWRETGGPPVAPPTRQGFGSRLITASLRGDLAGSARIDYAREGLTCELTIHGKTH